MRDRHDDLRSLADDIKADASRVHRIEDEAGRQDPGSQRFRDLSAESERLVKAMAVKTSAKRELAETLREDGEWDGDEAAGRRGAGAQERSGEPEPSSRA